MADATLNTKVISKNNSGFPDYLDFEKLRTEGITYLGELAGKIWTDHNVHDPGITILESLCYALLDLGYRTNLPVEDILSRAPGETTRDNNFFTPAQILGCNPLTITDYRKLLIDLDGVKNAWLQVATDQKDLCRNPDNSSLNPNSACTEYLNGLYHVYIETEKNPDKDFATAAEKEQYIQDVTCRVKKALMAHRNFCEDFVDVYILCKLEVGVCADIELDPDAEADKVYLEVAQQLRTFFSPAPQFYTLPQLLDKKLPIEDIFAGRPYNVTESHGFVDTNELERMTLKKEIHLSDVFNVIFQVPGVRKIKNLQLRTCNGKSTNQTGFKFKLPVNHVPDFTINCSGFQFSKNSRPVTIDTAKFRNLLELKFTNSGKILYTEALPNLDTDIPRGIYRTDLGDYYSIQNDFPRVYGIEEGGLPDSAPAARKAQALQLKAYLLFFDQLLANYLSQLKNIRSLFAMGAPDAANRHTYFLNGLESVPDLKKLLPVPATEEEANASGEGGSTLVYPVAKTDLLQWIADHPNTPLDTDALPVFTFGSLAEQEIQLQQLKDDLATQQYTTGNTGFLANQFDTNPSSFHYYLLPVSADFALISKKVFIDTVLADIELGIVIAAAALDENYRTFITGSNRVSFDIERNLVSFSSFLQHIVEDDSLYASRRNTFLDHLLSRFAEQFTDFALLSFKQFATEEAATLANINAKEDFLTHYDNISSNRGKAYDYFENNWNTDNISGFERSVKYISGIENKPAHSLCNFVVSQYDELFQVNVTIGNRAFFSLPEKFNSRLEAQETARYVINTLGDPAKLTTHYLAHERSYTLQLQYGNNNYVNFAAAYPTEQQADEVREALSRTFDPQPRRQDVFISEYMYRLQLLNHAGAVTRTAAEFSTVEQEGQTALQQSPNGINDSKQWQPVNGVTQPGNNLYLVAATSEQVEFVDVLAFKTDIDNTIIGHPDKFTYEVLDRTNAFKFSPVDMFNSPQEAEAHCQSILALGAVATNYQVGRNMIHQNFTLSIVNNGVIQAICATEFNTEEEAKSAQENIYEIIRQWVYRVTINKSPYRWKFNYYLGYEENERYTFTSVPEYTTWEEALKRADGLHQSVANLGVQQQENNILLSAGTKNKDVPAVALPVNESNPTVEAVQAVLDAQRSIQPLLTNTSPEAFDPFVGPDETSQQGLYVYRLVDKDNVYAAYSENFDSVEQAEEARKRMAAWLRQAHVYLDICLGGDITNQHAVVNSNTIKFHYQVKCHNGQYQSGPLQGQPLILFESVAGYNSADEAVQAFTSQYLDVLGKASDVSNYGTIISLDETILQSDNPNPDTIVFVPAATVQYFSSISTQPVAEQIAAIAKTYPVKKIKFRSQQFYDLFPCEEGAVVNNCGCSTDTATQFVYYFSLAVDAEKGTRWQSLQHYLSAEAARQDFFFFLLLLKYAGNLFVDCDNCSNNGKGSWRIYIREVLAESARRFMTEAEAWGEAGIEKFICAVQSGYGFHNYLRSMDCCYSFYLNCGQDLIVHPCKYDTTDKRTAVMQELYYRLQRFLGSRAYSTQWEENTLVLLDAKGQPFAKHIFDNEQNTCDWLVQLPNEITNPNNNYVQKESELALVNASGQTILQSYNNSFSMETWKAGLLGFACYFPVVVNRNETTGSTSYCIEIKLPGFNTCADDQPALQPCGCNDQAPATEPDCDVAWRSVCCYTSCQEAQVALVYALRLLLDFDNYQPVFDCECNSFGIALNFNATAAKIRVNDARLSGDLVAFNPQCYPTPDKACDAVKRAKQLTNGEGLHVVEHILLRPRSFDDCNCRQGIGCGEKMRECEFVWKVPDEDPCSQSPDICFVPGADPYSFIATVVLPAWPQRFRTPEGRLLMENILYRTAPAHTLLRILWLAPHDFCCFEKKYKNWRRHLAQKKVCNDNFSVCDFLDFLFRRNFECLTDCITCGPCTSDQPQTPSCFAESTNQLKQNQNWFTNEVNEIFCWTPILCGQYTWSPCEQPVITRGPDTVDTVTHTNAPAEPAAVASPAPLMSKARFVNSRMAGYKAAAEQVITRSNNNPLAIMAKAYLNDPAPTPQKTDTLITSLLDNAKPEDTGVKRLTRDMKKDLVTAIVWYYLDKISFDHMGGKQIKQLGKTFDKLRKAKIGVQEIYNDWNGPEVKRYEPEVDLDALHELVTGLKK